jgi:ATP-dependent 26S proteasome regulatory subunit
VVDFPMPDRALRRGLWGHCLAPLPLAGDVDLDFCAEAFELSGGDIRAIAVTIGYRVAAESRDVTMTDVIVAVGQEYRKLGRLCLEAEFGPYHRVLRA